MPCIQCTAQQLNLPTNPAIQENIEVRYLLPLSYLVTESGYRVSLVAFLATAFRAALP
jgi:hypothetical protein